LPPVTVGRAGQFVEVLVHGGHGGALTVEVVGGAGAVRPVPQADHDAEPRTIGEVLVSETRFVVPADVPPGYHVLRARSGERIEEGLLVVAPDRLDLPPQLEAQVWGLMTQIYSVRSRESWGIGDFGDLAGLASWGADLGAAFVLVNPLHAAEPVPPLEDSPYLPTSRRYLNPLYIRVTDIPEMASLSAVERARVDELGAGPFEAAGGLLDRQTSYAAKLAALARGSGAAAVRHLVRHRRAPRWPGVAG
jgi:4-alpha-glucanotransferase